MTSCDPVTLEIIRGAVRAAQSEMEALLERTAISAFIREKKDFYTALFDADGVMAVGSWVGAMVILARRQPIAPRRRRADEVRPHHR